MRRRRQLAAALAAALAALLVLASLSFSAPVFDDEDSPWPDTEAVKPNLSAVQEVVGELEEKVDLMELSASHYADWEACLHGVPISEYGDPDGLAGFGYDEVDGTGFGFKPALAIDRKSRPRHEDYLFLDFERGGDCRTAAPKPGGTAESASVRPSGRTGPAFVQGRTLRAPPGARHRGLPGTLSELEARVEFLKRAANRLEDSSERFDEWESCVSWVPVTEYGDPEGKFGYLFGAAPTSGLEYRPALAIDRSDWEDPEYEFLALVGGDRPGRTCQDEPGEAVD
ncbi:MAG TPA: hypothetical protein VFI03_09375 [Solirubrobacterales bacterium]|nr:hypothetical protein [Solirubrobacterales bacterium]